MAASGNNITAVHFSLIFFVMLSVILGVVSYLNLDKLKQTREDSAKAKADYQKLEGEWKNLDKNFTDLQNFLGFPNKLDNTDPNNPSSPIKQVQKHLENLGHDQSKVKQVLFKYLAEVAAEKDKLQKEKDKLVAAKKEFADTVAKADAARDAATKVASDANTAKDDAVRAQKAVETELGAKTIQFTQDLAAVKRDKQVEKERFEKEIEGLDKKMKDLMKTIALKQEIIDNLLNTTFERSDGTVRWVDHNTKLVWISLGSDDKLPERLTFSVYSQRHQGIARDKARNQTLKRALERDENSKKYAKAYDKGEDRADDIKGSIEVTRIVGAHLAEARILKNDLYNPIRAGDPIYTPLWSPGVEESFAFAVELDGRRFSGLDWNLLRRKVLAGGAKLVSYLDAKTAKVVNSNKGGITDKVKFLVITDLLPADQATGKERQRRLDMAAAQKAMLDVARRYGVRIVRLSDFLAYIGYNADRRLWRPGDKSKRQLKAGSQSTAVNQTGGRRQSSGQTSGVFTKRGRIGKGSSSGQTSKAFRGGRGY